MNTTAKTEKKKDPNVNYGMYLLDREAKRKAQTVLPYVLGGRDDPHFQDGNPPCDIPSQPNEILKPLPHIKPLAMRLLHFGEDIGGNWTPDKIEANEDIYGNDDDYWSLRDEGRSFGEGESYSERNA